MAKMRKAIFIPLVSVLSVIGLVLLTVIGYVLYVLISYNRIDDKVALTVNNVSNEYVLTGTEYTALTYNIGFGAYSPEYSFFMDEGEMKTGEKVSGKYAKAVSKEDAEKNTAGSVARVTAANADFVLLQEVDEKAHRSYKINQVERFKAIAGYGNVYAENFHTANLLYPFNDPIGQSNSGILSLFRFKAESSIRRQFPLTGKIFSDLFDLDRCFSVTRFKVTGTEKQLVLINLHMSAYDEGGTVRAEQLTLLTEFIAAEYSGGNYVIAGGDFNHDIAGVEFPTEQKKPDWVAVMDADELPDGFSIAAGTNAPTCRSADIPYEKGVNYCVVIDGFIISDNVKKVSVQNMDVEFEFSDHNPVLMTFELK